MNTLYYGDNLNILRRYIDKESVDLVYLDPPFNSNRNYNVLFKDESGLEADSLECLSKTLGIGKVRPRPTTIPKGSRVSSPHVSKGNAGDETSLGSPNNLDTDLALTHVRATDTYRLSLLHRRKPDDDLSRDDGRPPKLGFDERCRGLHRLLV